ncbi:zinc finger, CCHC-type containing protein [Tanacetum coccineum]|uniref:Zinc finger, CCHC-type containing protein n=1 Tax=Tanacetum coccineum TaxID=301880 RepID=A0ABQ5D3W1_9ASTR
MAAAAMKHMASNFAKLDKFEGMVVMMQPWNKLGREPSGTTMTMSAEAKYMAEDALSKKFLVSNFINYKKTDSRPVLEQYNELLGILGRFTQHKINMDESIQCGKPGHLKKDCKGGKAGNKANGSGTNGSVDGSTNLLKGATVHVCKDRCWFKTYDSLNDGSILHMGNKSTTLVHGRGCVDLKLNIVNDNIASAFMSTSKLNDSILWHARLGHVYFKRMHDMSKDGLISAFDMDTKKAVVRLPDPKLKTLGEKGIECIFVVYVEHSKAFRFYVIEPNDSVLINSINESRDAIFDENRFSSVPRPTLRIPNGIEDIGGSVVPEEVTEEACSFMLCDLYFWPSSLSLSSMPSCDLVSLTNMLILFIILKALFQSLRKSLSLNLELSRYVIRHVLSPSKSLFDAAQAGFSFFIGDN